MRSAPPAVALQLVPATRAIASRRDDPDTLTVALADLVASGGGIRLRTVAQRRNRSRPDPLNGERRALSGASALIRQRILAARQPTGNCRRSQARSIDQRSVVHRVPASALESARRSPELTRSLWRRRYQRHRRRNTVRPEPSQPKSQTVGTDAELVISSGLDRTGHRACRIPLAFLDIRRQENIWLR